MAERKYTAVEITDTCQNCGKSFAYSYVTGRRTEFCSDVCRKEQRHKLATTDRARCPQCSVDGCGSPATRRGTGLCEMHYYRVRRTGLVNRNPVVGRYVTGAGYIKILSQDHPLAEKGGHVYEHRAVAYASHGGICPDCHWCGTKLDWPAAVVDHLNESKADNEASNLVVTCNNCNRARGALLPLVTRLRPDVLDQFLGLVREHHERTASDVPAHPGGG